MSYFVPGDICDQRIFRAQSDGPQQLARLPRRALPKGLEEAIIDLTDRDPR